MKEELLHFVWQSKLLLSQSLTTTSGLPVTIVQPGNRNANAGPDFFNARLQIGDTIWAGNIEIHISSSDWDRHRHTSDEAYNNVILHVVYIHDREVLNAQGEQIPTLELRSFFANIFIASIQPIATTTRNAISLSENFGSPTRSRFKQLVAAIVGRSDGS